MNNNFLLDDAFLAELDNQPQRELWIKIIALTINEEPVEEITGRTTAGSISIDGSSKLRRSCSLTLVSDQLNINEYIWGLNTKVKILIGLKNELKPKEYGNIVWFPQGIFVLNSFSISITNNQSNISLQGKDKMCLLNGDLGGNLTAIYYVFDSVQQQNSYESAYYKKKLPLWQIIREAVHTYALEPYHNIIINDLDDWGLELLSYRGEDPMYFIYSEESQDIVNMTLNPEQEYIFNEEKFTISQLEKRTDFSFKVLNDFVNQNKKPTGSIVMNSKGEEFRIIKIETGMTCGYRITDLVYAKDLTLNVGDSITSMLDKIVTMLGNFEYFYNLDGQFVFQKKKTYVHTSWNNLVNNGKEQWADSAAHTSSHVYSLYNSKLVSSFSNAPALNNVKNDFSIWGVNEDVAGRERKIHLRYAIDKKPEYYKNMNGKIFLTDKSVFEKLKNDAKKIVLTEITDRIQNFELSHSVAEGLPIPAKQSDGSWTAGWWDIRDWHDYYYALTLEEPRYTMKWYSKNSIDGCVPANSLPIKYTYNLPSSSHVWLLIQQGEKFNPQHGTGDPSTSERLCTLHETFYNDKGEKITQKVLDANGKLIQKRFKYPYAGCNDDHTYLNFLTDDVQAKGNTVYFYNPDFPNYNSFEDLVSDQIEKEYKEYLDSGMLNLVDWREIIYQMALDYMKFNDIDNLNPDTILFKVCRNDTGEISVMTKTEFEKRQKNYTNLGEINLTTAIRFQNPDFYPTGMTGYEQYYIDMEGFWRQLYNPEYNRSYETEAMNALEFESIQEENKVFYDTPVYANCTASTIYYSDVNYYIKENDKYTLTMVTETEFNRDKSKYYYVKTMEITPVPIYKADETRIDPNETYYNTKDHSLYISGAELLQDPALAKNYSKRTETIKKIPVFKQEAYCAVYLYNTFNPNTGIYERVTEGITKGDYHARPWLYYRNKSGAQTCCTSINIPAPAGRSPECWFENQAGHEIKQYTNTWTIGLGNYDLPIALGKDTTNEALIDISLNATRCDKFLQYQKEHMPWFYCYRIYNYEPIIRPSINYNADCTYYVESNIKEFNPSDSEAPYWRYDLLANPESLIFWFDFLDTEGELENYSVPRIGDRPKAVNDNDVKAIYFRETPGVIFLEPNEWVQYTADGGSLEKPTGYAYAQMPTYMQHLFRVSGQGKSAKDALDEFLYQYSYCTESVTVSALPIYHLEPNTRVLIRDDNSQINGEYIINKLTIPLDSKGSMTINAVKAVDRLY